MIIALEGINGAGKSSLGALIQLALKDAGRPCVLTDPAGVGPVGQLIRKRIVDPSNSTNPDLDAALYAALRTEGAQRIIESLGDLQSTTVILERWSLALSAYGTADKADPNLLPKLRQAMSRILSVDLTVLLDIPAEVALVRLGNTANASRFASKDRLSRTAHWYRHFAQQEDRTSIIEATTDLATTFEKVRRLLISVWDDFPRANQI